MAELSKITIGDPETNSETTYDIKDAVSRERIGNLAALKTTAKTDIVSAINELAESASTDDDNVLRYDVQELTDEQKAQARSNIGVDEDFVRGVLEDDKYETIMTTLSPTETLKAYCIWQNTGLPRSLSSGDTSYVVKSYDITGISTVAITASSCISNYLYSFCNSAGSVIEKSEIAPGSTVTEIVGRVVQVPESATVLYVSYMKTASNDAKAQSVEQKLIGDTRKWADKKWVCIGDSLTAVNQRTTLHYHDYVAEATGIVVVNLGVSGTGYARGGDNTFNDRISSVPTDADVVTIFGSGNDISSDLELGEITDTGTETLCGRINTTIDSLIARMPAVQLGIVTPTPWVGYQPGNGNAMELYSDAIVEICKTRSIPCLDLYRCSNLRPWTEEGRTACYSKDDGNGVHPDETGHKLIASRFKALLESLLL